MGFKQEVANGIVESIADLRKGDDLEDFTVIVDGVSVRCHRFILGACSLFFRAMFRSGMRENKENCVTLKSVSHPTFTQILTALYTGHDILSEENVFEVWRAAHMLQIGFLVEECEVSLRQNISTQNYEEIYKNAKLLDSKLQKDVHSFMLKNFDIICTSQTLLELSVSEIKELIDSNELVVSSEDNVAKAIMGWISYTPLKTARENASSNIEKHSTQQQGSSKTPAASAKQRGHKSQGRSIGGNNKSYMKDSQKLKVVHAQTQTVMLSENRQEHLHTLVSAVRSCLLSPVYLEIMLSNPYIINNPVVRDKELLKAVYYQLQVGRRHGQWPSAAIHRYCSPLQNVVVWTCRRHSRQRDQTVWAVIVSQTYSNIYKANFKAVTGNFVNFDNELYELTDNGLQVFRDGDWKSVLQLNSSSVDTIVIAVANSIFFFSGNKVQSVDPKCRTPQLNDHKIVPDASKVTAVTSFKDIILVFGSHTSEQSDEETTVHTFDPSNETWKRLDNIGGPAKDLISFHTDKKTFLLQTNGSCWNVQSDGNGSVIITFNHKAWDFHWDLYGAGTNRDQLLIVAGQQAKGKIESICFPRETLEPHIVGSAARVSVTPIIMEKKYFTDKKSWTIVPKT